MTQSTATPDQVARVPTLDRAKLAEALDVSPHPGADGPVQDERAAPSPEFLTVFTSLACYPGALLTATDTGWLLGKDS